MELLSLMSLCYLGIFFITNSMRQVNNNKISELVMQITHLGNGPCQQAPKYVFQVHEKAHPCNCVASLVEIIPCEANDYLH